MNYLCFRCEYRAQFLEQEFTKKDSGGGPRFECQTGLSVNSCYMFRPVIPLVIEPSDYEKRLEKERGIKRPVGGYFGGRMTPCKEQPNFKVIGKEIEPEKYYIYNEIDNETKSGE